MRKLPGVLCGTGSADEARGLSSCTLTVKGPILDVHKKELVKLKVNWLELLARNHGHPEPFNRHPFRMKFAEGTIQARWNINEHMALSAHPCECLEKYITQGLARNHIFLSKDSERFDPGQSEHRPTENAASPAFPAPSASVLPLSG